MNPYMNYPLKRAQIKAGAGAGDIEAVAAVTGKKIVVVGGHISTDTAGGLTIKGGSTELAGPIYLAANTGHPFDNPRGVFSTAAGVALNIARSTSMAVGGYLLYHEVS